MRQFENVKTVTLLSHNEKRRRALLLVVSLCVAVLAFIIHSLVVYCISIIIMSPVDFSKSDSHLLARIDTSNDWSDIESLESHHSGPHLLASGGKKRRHSIGVIPSTPNGGAGYLSDDGHSTSGVVTSLRELDSILPSSTESEEFAEKDDAVDGDGDEPFASFVISVTNLDLKGTQTDEWETTLVPGTFSHADSSTTLAEDKPKSQTSSVEMTNQYVPTLPTRTNESTNTNNNSSSSNKASLKPIIRPRKPAVSAFDQENNTASLLGSSHIPLVRSHRRVSFNSLPSPKEVHEQGVEMSFTPFAKETKQARTRKKKKHGWSHRRPKALNATTNFR